MSYLPIVERELRVSSRNWKSYWGRSFAAGLAIIVASVPICSVRGLMPQESGRIAFIALSALIGLLCLWAGPATTADCLSSERREGTLGFLFLTDLRAYDIVLGKLAACSLRATYSLLAAVPVIGLPMLLGGISFWEFVRVAVAVGNILLFSLSAGILSSSIFKTAQNAVGWCVITLITLAGGLPLFLIIWAANHNTEPSFILMAASPGFALFSSFNEIFSRLPLAFYAANGVILIVSLICLRISCAILPTRWQDKPGTIKRQRWRAFWRDFQFGNAQWRAGTRPRLLDLNAFMWLASRIRHKRAGVSITIGVLTVLWLWAAIYYKGDWLYAPTYAATAIAMAYIFLLAIGSECVQPIAEARNLNALELLLCTPLSPPRIIYGQWLALKRTYQAPFLISIGLTFLLFLAGLGDRSIRSDNDRFEWLLGWICGGTVFASNLVTIFFLGMWSGLISPTMQTGMANTLFKVLMLPWMIFGCLCLACTLVTDILLNRHFDPPAMAMIVLWCLVSLSLNAWFTLRSRSHLQQRMREVAMTRFQKPLSPWQKLFGVTNTPAPN